LESKPIEVSNGYAAVTCPVCGTKIGVFESISYVDATSSWSGICGECGVRLEGERLERVKILQKRSRAALDELG